MTSTMLASPAELGTPDEQKTAITRISSSEDLAAQLHANPKLAALPGALARLVVVPLPFPNVPQYDREHQPHNTPQCGPDRWHGSYCSSTSYPDDPRPSYASPYTYTLDWPLSRLDHVLCLPPLFTHQCVPSIIRKLGLGRWLAWRNPYCPPIHLTPSAKQPATVVATARRRISAHARVVRIWNAWCADRRFCARALGARLDCGRLGLALEPYGGAYGQHEHVHDDG